MSGFITRKTIGIVGVIAALVLAWLSAGVSLLDDDWGHLKLASKGIGFTLSTGWEGLVGQGGYYRPIVVLSLYLNYLFGGYDPAGYHVLNVLIHVVCAVLVFVLGRQLQMSDVVCVGGAFLFFVLPIHTDSVFWIVGRTDTVCALFYLGAMIVFLRLLDQWTMWKLLALCVLALLAFLSKEMAFTLPGVLMVLAWFRQRLWTRMGSVGVGSVIGMMALCFVVRWWILGGVFMGASSVQVSVWQWGLDLAKSFAKFGMTDLKWFGMVLILVTGVLAVLQFRQERNVLRLPFVVLTAVCVVSLVPVLGRLHNWYLYLPSAFFCLVISAIWLQQSGRLFVFLFAGLIVYYGGVLVREGLFWREASQVSESFVADVLPFAQETTGRLFVLNTPSAWTPDGSLSGKPLFAFALSNAVRMRATRPVIPEIVMVNHVWLLRENVQCDVIRDQNKFMLNVSGGSFSFHGGDEGLIPPFQITRDWGVLQVDTPNYMRVEIDVQKHDRVVVWDGSRLRAY